jgi:hypothetical protein
MAFAISLVKEIKMKSFVIAASAMFLTPVAFAQMSDVDQTLPPPTAAAQQQQTMPNSDTTAYGGVKSGTVQSGTKSWGQFGPDDIYKGN